MICCFFRSDSAGRTTGEIKGLGTMSIDLGPLHLAPGVYMVKLAIWDKAMIHPYLVYNQDVFRMEMHGRFGQNYAVLVPDVKWKIN